MNLIRFTMEHVQHALDVCNAGAYAGALEFHQTDREHLRVSKHTGRPLKRRYISGVLRLSRCDAVGSLVYPHKRSRFADWQTHYDFMEQLFLQQPKGRIRSRFRGDADYVGLLGFYHMAGQLKSVRVQHSGVATTFGAMQSHGPSHDRLAA